ncbi:hypothetical protein D3C85_1515920 [compost metagenome]
MTVDEMCHVKGDFTFGINFILLVHKHERQLRCAGDELLALGVDFIAYAFQGVI